METTKVEFRLTAATNVGYSRDHNEDNFTVNPDLTQKVWMIPETTGEPLVLGKNGCVFVVADGMGGHNAGEVASAIAVSEVARLFDEAPLSQISKNDAHIEHFLTDIICKADQAIRKHAKENPASKGLGTTIILVWVIGNRAHLAWCGDSRAYIYNKEAGLARFSKDHSYVQELVNKGLLDEEMAFDHPQSNLITRCLGDFPAETMPEYRSYYLQPGDFILLCSDGLCGYCRDEEIAKVLLQTSDDLYVCNQKLIEAALNAGGFDNITTALFQFVSCTTENIESDQSDSENESNEEKIEVDTVKLKNKEHTSTIASSRNKYILLVVLSLIIIACVVWWVLNK